MKIRPPSIDCQAWSRIQDIFKVLCRRLIARKGFRANIWTQYFPVSEQRNGTDWNGFFALNLDNNIHKFNSYRG